MISLHIRIARNHLELLIQTLPTHYKPPPKTLAPLSVVGSLAVLVASMLALAFTPALASSFRPS